MMMFPAPALRINAAQFLAAGDHVDDAARELRSAFEVFTRMDAVGQLRRLLSVPLERYQNSLKPSVAARALRRRLSIQLFPDLNQSPRTSRKRPMITASALKTMEMVSVRW